MLNALLGPVSNQTAALVLAKTGTFTRRPTSAHPKDARQGQFWPGHPRNPGHYSHRGHWGCKKPELLAGGA